jgi:hypothetical protein
MISNATTSALIPKSDYMMAQDLYVEIDNLEARIQMLTSALKAVGVYDEKNDGIKRIFTEGVDNDLIPVKNWASFSEGGGLDGSIDWVPIKEISEVIINLKSLRDDAIGLLYQITGMSEILRGAGSGGKTAAGTQLEAKFASARVQYVQEDFARFASELLALKGEVITKHFQPQTIIAESNLGATPDMNYAQQSIQLLKDQYASEWRIIIKPESLAMIDYAALRTERMEFIQAVGFFTQSLQAMAREMPGSLAMMYELLKFGLSGFKGADEIEGVMDKAIEDAKVAQEKAAQQPPQPTPEQVKAQTEAGKIKLQAEVDAQEQQRSQQFDMSKMATMFQQEMIKLQAEFRNSLVKMRSETVAEIAKQRSQQVFTERKDIGVAILAAELAAEAAEKETEKET